MTNYRFADRIAGRLLSLLLLVLLRMCASQGSPPGGPEDKTPPQIVNVSPQNGATNVSENVKISMDFSEYVDKRSIEPAIFISPYVESGYEVEASYKSVDISFNEPLQDSTTYIITLGAGLTDLHGNNLAETFHLAFSTGDSLEQGRMDGQIYRNDMPKGQAAVLAYLADGDPVDSLLVRRPDYVTYPDQDGEFSFSNMINGSYLFLGLLDQNGNYLYDPGEWTGIPPQKFWTVADSITTDALQMQMFQYPADSLVLSKVEQRNSHLSVAGLNRPPKEKDLVGHYIFVDFEQDTLLPDAVSYGADKGEYKLEFYSTVPDSPYTLIARNFTDQFDLPFGKNRDRRDITISTEKDTLLLSPPRFSAQDSSKEFIQDATFSIQFDRAVNRLPADTLLAVTGIDPDTFKITWKDPRTIQVTPDSLWPPERWISWTLRDSLVRDYRDSTFSDSISTGSFQTETGDRYGSISGTITAPDNWDPDSMYIEAVPVSENVSSTGEKYTTNLNTQNRFMFRRLPAGLYQLSAFYDEDGSGDYSFGRPVSFVPAEKFVIFPNELQVRARWETSGIKIQFSE